MIICLSADPCACANPENRVKFCVVDVNAVPFALVQRGEISVSGLPHYDPSGSPERWISHRSCLSRFQNYQFILSTVLYFCSMLCLLLNCCVSADSVTTLCIVHVRDVWSQLQKMPTIQVSMVPAASYIKSPSHLF